MSGHIIQAGDLKYYSAPSEGMSPLDESVGGYTVTIEVDLGNLDDWNTAFAYRLGAEIAECLDDLVTAENEEFNAWVDGRGTE